jgi:hypothetical protein
MAIDQPIATAASSSYQIQGTLKNWEPILKELWDKQRMVSLTYEDHPTLALMPKNTELGGKTFQVPLKYANPQNTSNTLSKLLGVQNTANGRGVAYRGTKYNTFHYYTREKYSKIQLDRIVMKAARGGLTSAVAEMITEEYDNTIKAHIQQIQADIFGDGSGSIGNCVNAVLLSGTTYTFTLANYDDLYKFEVGMALNFFTKPLATGTLYPDVGIIVGRGDRTTGTLLIDFGAAATADLLTNAAAAGNPLYICRDGDAYGAISGFAGHLPITAPTTGDNWFGVDRTADVEKLSGMRLITTGANVIETTIEGVARLQMIGARPNYAIFNNMDLIDIQKQMFNKVVLDSVDMLDASGAPLGFKGLKLATAKGEIILIGDPYQTRNQANILSMDTWELASIGDIAELVDEDGLSMTRGVFSDTYEMRAASYLQLVCRAPGHNGVITW